VLEINQVALDGVRKFSSGNLLHGFVRLKVTMSTRITCVDNPFGRALMVEVRDLLSKNEVFEQRRPAVAAFERNVMIGNR
jgi:hypothetical protein